MNEEADVDRKGQWRHRLVSILPTWFRPTANKKKRRALASLVLAASFTFSRPVGALPSKDDTATSEELRASSNGITLRGTVQLTSTSFNRETQLATIPVSSKKGTFWTKRRVIMLAAGGGTVLGLSLVPPISDDEDEMNEKSAPSLSELQVQHLPSSISKEAFRELEQLFGGDKTAKASETDDAEKFVRSSVPLIEEDVRVISDPSADIIEKESPAKTKPKGIEAVKKVTPRIQEDLQDRNVKKDATMDQGKMSEKKEEAIEEQLQATDQVVKKRKGTESVGFTQNNEGSNGLADELDYKSKNDLSLGEPVQEDDIKKTAEASSLLKKEEATRRAILEERLKEEARRLEEETRLRKSKEEEAARRALLEERLKQESLLTETKKDDQASAEKIEDANTVQAENVIPEQEKIPEINVPMPLNNKKFVTDEASETSTDMSSTIGRKKQYRRQPLSPDEEAELQKKYIALPLKERAYRILVDLGMIDSPPE
ncbi:hypothetical protein FisN_9Lh186 [Fistulifera solaris]|uniref:Uncharacterized protein n=1 Tax=Fistulifera solaris TaxID=1519565 RepID=A0A1Z5KKP3_FISSO|nr:hypothetical protein FisN_9Lh186 [Fistulifera solaris]|eukprot:GAX26890.1 hypothetical protein FisN_9Lh186 [Fistulifera solaris]